MYSLVSLLSGIYPLPAMHSLLVTLYGWKKQKRDDEGSQTQAQAQAQSQQHDDEEYYDESEKDVKT